MARVKLSESGDLHVPQAMRESLGLVPGAEVEVTESAGRLIVAAVVSEAPEERPRLTLSEFLERIPRYEGPPITLTDALIEDAIMAEAKRDWERLERQRNGDDND